MNAVGPRSEQRPPAEVPPARVMLRPIASPFPLGFSALATASLLAAGTELGWFAAGDRTVIALTMVAFAFPLQMLASVFGFLGRDTAAATGFGVQGATWLLVGLSVLTSAPASTDHALGVLLLASAGWVSLCALGAATGKLIPAAVLLLAAVRFALTGIYELTAGKGIEHAAAIVGLVLVGACAYVILATELENLKRRTVLPLGRHGSGREAMESGLEAQSQGLEHEAGVREQL